MPGWKGSISFGLVYIPVTLELAAKEESTGFNLLHANCGGRVNYKKVCSVCGKELTKDDIRKGYNYEHGKYVVFDDNDFELLKTSKNRNIVIEQFSKLSEIDPIYFEKSYYVVPNGGEKAFYLLKRAMDAEKKVGIAKTVMGSKESLVALRVHEEHMLLNTLYFENELRNAPSETVRWKTEPAEVKLARVLINGMTSTFKPEEYHDGYQQKLKEAIECKIAGKEIIAEPQGERVNNVIDLIDVLRESIRITEEKVTGASCL